MKLIENVKRVVANRATAPVQKLARVRSQLRYKPMYFL